MRFLCSLLPWLLVVAFHAQARVTPFVQDTRWMLVGDSITQDGRYAEFVRLFLATRFPGRDITLLNAGTSGDTAEGALRRYEWDIAPRRPTFVTVMFGMNDVGRDHYQDGEPSPETLGQRATCLRLFREHLTTLAKRLQSDGAEVVLVTPSIFDDTAALPSENRPGCNTGLAGCADIVREVAAATGAGFVDVHTPMTALNLAGQRRDPASSLVGGDRIHPRPAGDAVITKLMLQGLDAPSVVSRVEIDAARLAVISNHNAKVDQISRDTNGIIRFTVHARSLPFPVNPDIEASDFTDTVSREVLRITGLSPGSYALSIDNTPVRAFTADELAAGVRLDRETSTPQHRQATAVAEAVARWADRIRSGERAIAQVEHQQFGSSVRPLVPAEAIARVSAKLAALPDQQTYQGRVLSNYLREKPQEAGIAAEIEACDAAIVAASRTVPREYLLVPQGI